MQVPLPNGRPRAPSAALDTGDDVGAAPRPHGRVLIIAGDDTLRDVLAIVATIEGCEVRSARIGTAEDLLASWDPDVILLELGAQVAEVHRVIRRYREQARVPVAVVIIADERLRPERLAQIGADAALPKPFQVEELLALLERFAGCREG
jgi:two-component system KDP operon response regulator KdpE